MSDQLVAYAIDQEPVGGLCLKKGPNLLVLKVMNNNQGWEASRRFSDRDGQPLRGIRVTLDLADGKP